MIKENNTQHSEYQPITCLCFGSVVTLKDDRSKHYLILDAKGVENIHGSLIYEDETGKYIIAGGGGTMSLNDFGFFVEKLSYERTIELIERGWKREFGQDLPEDLRRHFQEESKSAPLIT